jgi:hypothetical protein
MLAACATETRNLEQSTAAEGDPADVAFGYTNATNTRLLMMVRENDPATAARAQKMEMAVCAEGRPFPIRYMRFQEPGPRNNGRQSSGNFENDGGHLFELMRDRPPSQNSFGGETCLMLPANYLRAYPIVQNAFTEEEREARANEFYRKSSEAEAQRKPLDLASFQPADHFGKEAVLRIEKEKARGISLYWLLHRSGESQVASVEFNAIGDNLLAGIVLVESERIFFHDVPANRKDFDERGGCWRIDDGCRFNSEDMDVPAILGTRGDRLVFYTSWGQEGQIIKLFQAKDGKLVELADAYRYHMPV